jgi:adenosylhomocysteine nucleosidase
MMTSSADIVVIISANIEWQAVQKLMPDVEIQVSPYGNFFLFLIDTEDGDRSLIFFHGGWGKIAAAASAQYAIDRWQPNLLINLGTCGGIEGEIEQGVVILVDRTIVYDIDERMGDRESHIKEYSTPLDLSWLKEPYPEEVWRDLIISADRDLRPEDLNELKMKYGAVAADWESGAIAYVAKRNEVPCLILRAVSDLVSQTGGEAYGDISRYEESVAEIMGHLLKTLPLWIKKAVVILN